MTHLRRQGGTRCVNCQYTAVVKGSARCFRQAQKTGIRIPLQCAIQGFSDELMFGTFSHWSSLSDGLFLRSVPDEGSCCPKKSAEKWGQVARCTLSLRP